MDKHCLKPGIVIFGIGIAFVLVSFYIWKENMRTQSNHVFVSVYLASKSLEVNKVNHDKARLLLEREGRNVRVVNGSYKGTRELSFLLSSDSAADHADNLDIALQLGLLFSQKSVLEVCNDNTAYLHFINNASIEKLGIFTEVNKELAIDSDAYTHEPVSDRYFVVRWVMTGKVKWWNDSKGYGFIEASDGSPDVFAHYTAIPGEGFKTLREGATVSFDLVDHAKGPMAANISYIETV
jgi:cold shock protein